MKHKTKKWYSKRTVVELMRINAGYTRYRQGVKAEQLKLNEVLTDLTRNPPKGRSLVVKGRRYPASSIWEWWRHRADSK